MKQVKILTTKNSITGAVKTKKDIKSLFPNIICQRILNVFGKKKLQIQ